MATIKITQTGSPIRRTQDQRATLIGLGVPLYLVTMASQNLPGFAVLRASGYQPPTQPVLAVTGAASLATAFLGAHTSKDKKYAKPLSMRQRVAKPEY